MLLQTIENTCPRCEVHFRKWTDYHLHRTTVVCAKKFHPINLSGRSKSQIVSDWESKNSEVLIK